MRNKKIQIIVKNAYKPYTAKPKENIKEADEENVSEPIVEKEEVDDEEISNVDIIDGNSDIIDIDINEEVDQKFDNDDGDNLKEIVKWLK